MRSLQSMRQKNHLLNFGSIDREACFFYVNKSIKKKFDHLAKKYDLPVSALYVFAFEFFGFALEKNIIIINKQFLIVAVEDFCKSSTGAIGTHLIKKEISK